MPAKRVLSLLDARKQRVYACLYEQGEASISAGPADISAEEAAAWAGGPFVATGEGALVYADVLLAAGATLADGADDPAVDVLARLGGDAYARGEGVDAGAVSPVYLRRPDAKTIAERAG